MLNILGSGHRLCDGLNRREFLTLGALGMGGLGLADVLRLQAEGAADAAPSKRASAPKSVIMITLPGGPSHIDTYDPKPEAPIEFRGDFKTIPTKVSGLNLCEYLPLHAEIADKFSVIRGIKWRGKHDPYELLSGYPSRSSGSIQQQEKWPVMGSIVSRIRSTLSDELPHYVNVSDLRGGPESDDPEVPRYMGAAHGPFRTSGPGLANLKLPAEVSLQRLEDRQTLLSSFDKVRHIVDTTDSMRALDAFQQKAVGMVTSGAVYKALDLNQEDPQVRSRFEGCTNLLLARRLVEAGVSVVTVAQGGLHPKNSNFIQAVWDTHKQNFRYMREMLPGYDYAIHTLINDLYERGLDKQVAVVIWGEFGRTPRIGTEGKTLGEQYSGGRDHWWDAGCAVMVGGGLKMGQVIGETDGRAERNKGRPYMPQNVLSTLYHVLGIDPARTFPDYQGRPVHLLDDRERITELL